MFNFFRAIRAIKKLKRIKPDDAWLKNIRSNFSYGLPEKTGRRGFSALNTRFAAGAVAAALILSVGGGIINSAQAALPSDSLYPIKLLSEQFQSFFIFGDEHKIDFAFKLAERRLDEAEEEAGSVEVGSEIASTSPFFADNVKIKEIEEGIFVGTISRAGENLEKVQTILSKYSQSNKNTEKKLKNLEKTLNRLEKVKEKKENLFKKLEQKIAGRNSSALAAVLGKIEADSVNIEKEVGKVIVTIYLDENEEDDDTDTNDDTASTTPDGDEEDEDSYEKNYPKDVSQIVKLLTDGAGKSGKIPPGLLKAPGLRKKIERVLGEEAFDDIFNDDENEEDDNDEEDDEDNDLTAPVITSVSVSNIATSSATINWITADENSTSKVYYGSTTPLDIGSASFAQDNSLVTDHSLDITGLSASSTYYFVAESTDANNNTATSSELDFTTVSQ